MYYKSYYNSKIGKLLLISTEEKLIGLFIENQKYYLGSLKEEELIENNKLEIIINTKKWLDKYFTFKKPSPDDLKLEPIGSPFRQIVWKELKKIPYGKTITYSDISHIVARLLKKESMSAQAIGNAVGHNPISIIIPCHRVIGKNNTLTGYAGGLEKKRKLLQIENVDTTNLK